ncbi:MAG: MFS transporter [Actinomycetota bacterium]|jgi:FSR family fosmidomycin resistance protein-like MFS transporter|nr:MFS transporter [Actinomycetota bacterium]
MADSTSKFNKLQVSLSATSHLVTDLYSSFIVGLIPVLATKFGLSLFLVSILTSTNYIANSFTQPIFGLLSDRHGTKKFMVAGPMLAAIFISMLGVLPSYWLILIFLFLGNLSISAFHPSSASIAGHFGGEKRGLGNSIISFGGNLGYAAGSLFIIFIIEKIGLPYTPLTMVPGIIMSAILLKTLKSPNLNLPAGPHTNIFKKVKKVKKPKLGLLAIIIFTSFSRDLIWVSLATFLPLHFTQKNITLLNVGYLLLAFGVIGAIGGVVSGYLNDKGIRSTILIQLGLLLCLPLFFLVFRTEGMWSILFYISGGFFLISTLPVCIRLSQQILPANLGLASSLVIGLSGGTAAITMIFLGKVADMIGVVATMNIILVIPLVSIMLLLFFPWLKARS